MAEVGSPVMAEMQPQRPATRLQDRLGKWARETLTPTGRAEVMAQRQIDSILAQVPEEKRAQAMEMLEARRPDLVAGKMEDAKGSLVRDAVIIGTGAAVFGGGALVLSKNERVRSAVVGLGKKAADTRVGKGIGGIIATGKDKATNVVNWILRKKVSVDSGQAATYIDHIRSIMNVGTGDAGVIRTTADNRGVMQAASGLIPADEKAAFNAAVDALKNTPKK